MMLLSFLLALQLLQVPAPVFNRAPLEHIRYAELSLGAIRPEGWLKEQLQRQASGLTGHLDEVYPEVMGPDNAWLGGDGDAWERGPYWIDGLLPLAYILDDPALKAKAGRWVEAMLASQQEDGYFGPAQDHPFVYGLQRGKSHDWWPKMVALKILKQYYLATGDTRVLDCLKAYFRYQLATLPDKPLNHWSDWGHWRGADNLEVIYWLYNLTAEPWLLDLGELVHSQTYDWTEAFRRGAIFREPGSVHTVNLAQGFKAPLVWWQSSGNPMDFLAARQALEVIRTSVGLPTGLWAGDEQLQFGLPTRGSELCAAVEMMFSLEEMLRISDDMVWADQLERVAFNALPAQVNADCTAKQYYQQVNQIACTREWRPFSTPHEDGDNLFGTLNGYPCCLSNLHQGWPKFTQNLWYATADGGLAALLYAPCSVKAKVVGGVEVCIAEETDYPFKAHMNFRVSFTDKKVKSATFPLHLRVPGWSAGAVLRVNGAQQPVTVQGGTVTVKRTWKKGDTVTLELKPEVQVESWCGGAWTVVRGPLVYALKMEETWTWDQDAWTVTSDTPWNYCLMRDSFQADSCVVNLAPTVAPYPWTAADAPVTLEVPARVLPHWHAYNGSTGEVAYWTEEGNDTGDPVTLELIPYGCTTLRIAAFPTRIVPWDIDFKKKK